MVAPTPGAGGSLLGLLVLGAVEARPALPAVDNVPADQIIGNQSRRERFPDLDAVIVQVGYRFKL